jgi:hypothetical protein
MKNMKSILLILVIASFLQSCGGDRTPILDGSKPFVVGAIEKMSDSHSIYYSENYASGHSTGFITEDSPAIILPSRIFQIGDTIKANFTKIK